MSPEYIKTVTQEYFVNLGMLTQEEMHAELFNTFFEKIKNGSFKATRIGKEFSGTYKPKIFDFLLFGSDTWHTTEFLSENIVNIILDLNVHFESISEHMYADENIVSILAKTDTVQMYCSLHSYKASFTTYSLKYPLFFVFMVKHMSKT